MNKKYCIEDIDPGEIKHADIDKFEFDAIRKIFYINLHCLKCKSISFYPTT